MRTYVVSPRCTSESARTLARHLSVSYASVERLQSLGESHTVINWGYSGEIQNCIVNTPRTVRRSINKLRTFELLNEHVPMPSLTLDRAIARGWVIKGNFVVMRNRIKGSKSQGVLITNRLNIFDNTPAKFYTKYIPHLYELRLNCYKDNVITVYNKVRADGDFKFKYVRNAEREMPVEIQTMATEVYKRIGGDTYGLDVLVTRDGKYFLLEVNSAPILFPITVSRLAKRIKHDYNI